MSMTVVGVALIIAFVIVLIIVIAAIWSELSTPRAGRRRPGRESLAPGAVRAVRLISDSEAAFYWTLKKAVGERWVIAVKVPLSYVLKRRSRLPSELYSMLSNGHVDFLLLHPRSWEPVLGIELDDSTHQTPTRQDRDRRKEALFRLAGIPLLRWSVGQAWDVEEVAQAVWKALPGGRTDAP